MALLYISEFNTLGGGARFPVQGAQQTPVATQQVNFGGGATASNTFNDLTNFVRLHTDSICSIKFGTAPVASTSDARMAANQTEYYSVAPGSKLKVSAVINT